MTKATLKYDSEAWIFKKRDARRLKVAETWFLHCLLSFIRLDHQQGTDVRKKLHVSTITIELKATKSIAYGAYTEQRKTEYQSRYWNTNH
jgi:hypothetical protein